MKILKGDTVLVLAGKDSAKTGKVVSVDTKGARAIVEGVNIYKKHAKPSRKYPQGGIIDKSVSIDLTNLMVVCPNCNKPSRLTVKNTKREKRRVCRRCSEVINAK